MLSWVFESVHVPAAGSGCNDATRRVVDYHVGHVIGAFAGNSSIAPRVSFSEDSVLPVALVCTTFVTTCCQYYLRFL